MNGKERVAELKAEKRVFRIRTETTNAWWEGEAEDPSEALNKSGLKIYGELCAVKELTPRGGWRKCFVWTPRG